MTNSSSTATLEQLDHERDVNYHEQLANGGTTKAEESATVVGVLVGSVLCSIVLLLAVIRFIILFWRRRVLRDRLHEVEVPEKRLLSLNPSNGAVHAPESRKITIDGLPAKSMAVAFDETDMSHIGIFRRGAYSVDNYVSAFSNLDASKTGVAEPELDSKQHSAKPPIGAPAIAARRADAAAALADFPTTSKALTCYVDETALSHIGTYRQDVHNVVHHASVLSNLEASQTGVAMTELDSEGHSVLSV